MALKGSRTPLDQILISDTAYLIQQESQSTMLRNDDNISSQWKASVFSISSEECTYKQALKVV